MGICNQCAFRNNCENITEERNYCVYYTYVNGLAFPKTISIIDIKL